MKMPKRIAILLPELHSDTEPAVRRAAELILWGALNEAAALHHELAVADIGETWLDRRDGQLSPHGGARTTADENAQFSQKRRDEIVYVEAALDKPGVVRLHMLSSSGERSSFEALGQNLGEQIGRALSAWLHAGELDELPRPLDHFSADDLLSAARALSTALEAAQKPEASMDSLVEKLAPTLKLPALRVLGLTIDGDATPHLAALDPLHSSARLAEYRMKAERGQRDWSLLRQIVATTRGWATPWLELKNDPKDPTSPSRLEALGAAGMAVFLDPERRLASEQLADALGNDRRRDEALRASARGVALHDDEPQAHIGMLDRYLSTERLGDWLRAAHRAGWMHGCPMDSPYPWTGNQVTIDLCVSSALMNNGRLDEAIALRKNRLELASGNWARAQKTLDDWRKNPKFVAWCYAREGYARGEDARTVEGFSRIEPGDGVDIGMFLDALVATGRERDVPYAWAQFGLGRRFNTTYARLSAARTLFCAGEWKMGIEELFAFELQFPSRDDHAAVAHAARLLTAAPRDVLDGAIAERTREGAHTLARALDRTIADFTGRSPLPPPARPIPFDPGWLAHFAADTRSRAAIDSLFAETVDGDGDAQLRADHLVNRWNQVVFVEASSEDKPNLAQAIAYAAAQALSRYLALTTQAPTVLAGACRTVAAESLQALHALHSELREADLSAVLHALDPLIGHVDERLVEHWLAALERALRLDERWQGRMQAPVGVAAHLFGPDSLAHMSLHAAELVRDKPEGWAAETATLCARLTWLTGRTGVDEWSLAVEMLGGDTVDALLTCAAIARWRVRSPAVRAARALFGAGNKEAAFRVLVDGVGAENDGYKDPAVLALEEPWTRSGLDVPFGFKEAVTQAFDLGQKSQPAQAARVLSWPCALDSNNAEAQRNLGLFLAQQNKVFEALERLIRATRDQGTQLCAGILYQAGHVPSALAVLDYASRWYLRADQWLTYGGIVYGAMDNPRTVRAYSLAWELDPDAFDPSQLNGYAGVLDEVGDYLTCEKIAQKLIDKAGDDPTWISNGALQMACALIGQGRFDEALPYAERAAKTNPLPANAAICQTVLERARTRTKAEVPPPLPPVSTREEWFALMDRGDLKQAAELVQGGNWRARRAGLRASSFRFTSENRIKVTQRGRDAADLVLEDTRGATDLDALVCRTLALTLRAQAAFPRDPVPQLGDRMTREAFYAEFRARGGVILGEAPELKPAFVDREVAPHQPIATASAYVALLRDLARLTPKEALAAHHLDEANYLEVAKAWAVVFDADATLWETIASGLGS